VVRLLPLYKSLASTESRAALNKLIGANISEPDKSHFIDLSLPILLAQKLVSSEMSAIYILISVSFIVAIAFLGAFIWSIKSGQYDDDYSPSVRMLKDDRKPKPSSKQ
jgi:cbb3-type cytochrome oxidase maturation protein